MFRFTTPRWFTSLPVRASQPRRSSLSEREFRSACSSPRTSLGAGAVGDGIGDRTAPITIIPTGYDGAIPIIRRAPGIGPAPSTTTTVPDTAAIGTTARPTIVRRIVPTTGHRTANRGDRTILHRGRDLIQIRRSRIQSRTRIPSRTRGRAQIQTRIQNQIRSRILIQSRIPAPSQIRIQSQIHRQGPTRAQSRSRIRIQSRVLMQSQIHLQSPIRTPSQVQPQSQTGNRGRNRVLIQNRRPSQRSSQSPAHSQNPKQNPRHSQSPAHNQSHKQNPRHSQSQKQNPRRKNLTRPGKRINRSQINLARPLLRGGPEARPTRGAYHRHDVGRR
jgi:hypothetical protein